MNLHPSLKHLLPFLLQFCLLYASAQRNTLDSLQKRFDSFRRENLQEKLYLHSDQQTYLTGETLWFKAYCVDGSLHKPVDISKVAYVEIVNSESQSVLKGKISLKDGFGTGSLFLPASLPSGNYRLRAYTHWMRNFGAEFYFQKTITLINPFQKPENIKPVVTKVIEGHFFPEGGNLVAGAENKVGFRINDAEGLGLDFIGTLVNDKNDSAVTFKPFMFGMGTFTFVPVAGAAYKAIIVDKKNGSATFTLPAVQPSGFVLRVAEDNEQITIRVLFAGAEPASRSVFVFVHSRQRMEKVQSVVLQGNTATLNIRKADLLDGISHITVFDENLQPVCERLFYNGKGSELKVESYPLEETYGTRRKVTLDLTTSDNLIPTSSNLSIAVSKSDSLAGETAGILSYLSLGSDLKGRIESLAYYLNPPMGEAREAFDNLMLTHGWSRFTWTDVVAQGKTQKVFIPEYRGHFIFGKVVDPAGAPVMGVASYLAAPGKNIQLRATRSGVNGDVRFEMKDFYGPKKIMAQVQSETENPYKIEIIDSFSDKFNPDKLPPFQLSPSLEKQLLDRSVGMQVQDIFYKEKSDRYITHPIDSLPFYGHSSEAYLLDDYTRFPVMEEVLREYVKGVFVRKRKDQYYLIVLDNEKNALLKDEPLMLVDGLPVFDANKIIAFDALKVKRLDVVKGKYFSGPIIFSGIVSFQTYAGDLGGFPIDPQTVVMDYEGLQMQQEFYSPQYETPEQKASRLPDRRNLLYWAPTVISGDNGKAKLEFYTSDLTGKFNIRIEGITSTGAAGSKDLSFIVK